MTAEDDPRAAAIKRYNDRAARDQREAAEHHHELDAQARQQGQNLAAWPAASNAIYLGVNATNDHFARGGSQFVISMAPTTAQGTALFEIKPSGQPDKREAWFKLAMDGGGIVRATTNTRGVKNLPDAVAVADVTAAWAQKVADQAMIAVLDGQHTRIPD
jgi:hypothetical protein